MDFIDHHKCDRLHIASVLPISADTIPLLRGGDQYISFLEGLNVRSDITCQFQYDLTKRSLLKSLLPVYDSFLGKCLEWSNIDDLRFRRILKHTEHGQLRHDGLAGTCWGSDQDIRICMEQGVEDLGLDWVEEFDILFQIELLEFLITQARDMHGPEVEQLGVRVVLIRDLDL